MTNLQENIDKYMDLEGIRYYSDLLCKIGKWMGKSEMEARRFADSEKSNFSKMLKGERPLKHEYIIPLEKIFGVPLAKMLDKEIYFDSVSKEDIPFLKSFRYYAYKNDPALYDELDRMSTVDGDDIINNKDEYDRAFIDYLIEYQAYNGLKYLVSRHRFRLNPMNPVIYETDGNLLISTNSFEEITKFAVNSNDPELFDKIYDPFAHIFQLSFGNNDSLYDKDYFLDSIVNNDKIFDSLFAEKTFPFSFFNEGVEPKNGEKPSIICINPLLNKCFNYCLKKYQKYKKQVKAILEYGAKYNQKIISALPVPQEECYVDSSGNVFVGSKLYLGNILCSNVDTYEGDLIELIKRLPGLKKGN